MFFIDEKAFRDRGSGIYKILNHHEYKICLLYTSDAPDE